IIATTVYDTISNFTLVILSENICYIFPMSVILTKMIFAFFNENKIRKIVEEIYKPIMILKQSSDVGVLTIIQTAMSYQFFDSAIYIFLCISISGTTFLLVDIERYELPIRGVFLINATVSPNYQVIFAIETYAIIINCWWLYSLDTVLLGLVRWITIDLKILQLNYRQCQFFYEPRGTLMVTQEGFNAVKNYSFIEKLKNEDEIYNFVPFDEKQTNVTNDSFLLRFCDCVKNHRRLIESLDNFNELFGLILFAQIASDCLLTCIGLFQFSLTIKRKRKNNIFRDMVMLGSGLIHLGYWSVYGNLLINEHERLSKTVYACGWENHNGRKIKPVVVFGLYQTLTPMVMKAGYFFVFGMETYLSVIQKAYSYFAILNTMMTN
ncbi:GSCOCT00013608001.3-RA-CDS, partial [Cotesia congregata]